MNKNLEKALYLGTGLMLCLIALSLFFSHYEEFQRYIAGHEHLVQEDKLVSLEKVGMSQGVTYEEVVFQVLKAKERQEARMLSDLYAVSQVFNDLSPTPAAMGTDAIQVEIRVNGIRAEEVDLESLVPGTVFQCTHETDNQGRVLVLNYTGSP